MLEAGADGEGVLAADLGNDAAAGEALMVPNFGTAMDRIDHDMLDLRVMFDGREIFRRAVKGMTRSGVAVLSEIDCGVADVDLMIPHQANGRIIDAAGHRLGLPAEKVYVNVDRFGNTSAASVPIALSEAIEQGRVAPGDLILFTAFGAGLSRAAAAMRWGPRAKPLAQSGDELTPCEQSGLDLIRRNAEAMRARMK
ncbi:MAG: 3-oxoacyl-ACP synthase III family protein [Gammaproteobacteria bacterium]